MRCSFVSGGRGDDGEAPPPGAPPPRCRPPVTEPPAACPPGSLPGPPAPARDASVVTHPSAWRIPGVARTARSICAEGYMPPRPTDRSNFFDANKRSSVWIREARTFRADMKRPSGGERRDGQDQPPAPPQAVAQGEKRRPERSSEPRHAALEGARAEHVPGDAEVRQRLEHRDTAASPDRVRGGHQRDEEADGGDEQEDPGRHGEARDVEVQEHGHRPAERPAPQESGGQSDTNGRQPQEERFGEIDARDLSARRADRLHHADLPDLGRHDGGQQVDDEDAAQDEDAQAEARHREEQHSHDVGVRMPAGLRHVESPHGVAASLDDSS